MADFTVTAGKYDNGERNVKYIEDFDNIENALTAYLTANNYQFCELEEARVFKDE